tara:strand:- start:1110 stop:1340 length:231 start_codon:yes stop_codon:yes gene_type:complete
MVARTESKRRKRLTKYTCSDCGMEVENMRCGKCGAELEHGSLALEDGSTVGISECPNGCGKIKSPACCGADMTPDG